MDAEGKVESFEKVSTSHNKDVAKGSSEAEIEFEHALALGFSVRLVGSLEGEATVGPLAICKCRRDGTDVSIRVHYEGVSGTSSTQLRAESPRRQRRN